jgi:hypothetical protein
VIWVAAGRWGGAGRVLPIVLEFYMPFVLDLFAPCGLIIICAGRERAVERVGVCSREGTGGKRPVGREGEGMREKARREEERRRR